jgi:hypothetical protein
MSSASVGGEVEAWCTTCKIMKDHVVVAVVAGVPAKVECMGCGKQHMYRAQPPGTAKPRTSRVGKSVAVTPTPVDDLEAKLAAGASSARIYAPRDTYAVGDFVKHPTFGVGLVIAVPAAQKAEIAFSSGRKLLVHARGAEAPASSLERPPRRDDDAPRIATDAPPPKAGE